MKSRSRRRRRGVSTRRFSTFSWWRRTTSSTSLLRSVEEPATSWSTRRSSRYANAKSTDRTSHEKEADGTKRAGCGDDQGFVCPSRFLLRQTVEPLRPTFDVLMDTKGRFRVKPMARSARLHFEVLTDHVKRPEGEPQIDRVLYAGYVSAGELLYSPKPVLQCVLMNVELASCPLGLAIVVQPHPLRRGTPD